MPGLSRRTFLTRGSLAVVVGSAAAVPGLGSLLAEAPEDSPEVESGLTDAEAEAAADSGPVVAHVSDLRSGEISLYQGENEVVIKDPALATRLFRTISEQGR